VLHQAGEPTVAALQSARPAGPASKLRASALMATSPGLALKICTRLKESGGTRGDESGRRGPERAGEKDNGSVPKIVPADAACSHGKTTAQPPPSTAPDIASSSRAGSFCESLTYHLGGSCELTPARIDYKTIVDAGVL